MGVILLSLKLALFYSVATVISFPQDANAWGTFRISVPRIYIPRTILHRIRLPPIKTTTRATTPTTASSSQAFDPCSVIISRSEWEAPHISEGPPIRLPMYMIAKYLRGHSCNTRQECTKEAKQLYTEKENYNFMIGGDGTVFEGRGWDKFSNHYFSNDHVEYAVAYIGESITEKMRESFLYWRACGTSKGMLQIDITSENHFSRH